MTPALREHLRTGASRPFSWGDCDCSLWVADWVAARRGLDPASGLRGRYRTARGAARHVQRAGGLLALAGRAADVAGLAPTDAPRAGDVGIVDAPWGVSLALRTARGWAVKSAGGIVVADLPALAAWRV